MISVRSAVAFWVMAHPNGVEGKRTRKANVMSWLTGSGANLKPTAFFGGGKFEGGLNTDMDIFLV